MPKKSVAPIPPERGAKLELSEHLPYLFRHVYAQLEAASAGHLARFSVNVAVWRILAVLSQHGDLSHRELSELTSIEVSTLSRVSKAVQRDGLIRRKRLQADQRTVRVTLTEKGHDLVHQIIPSAQHMQREIVGNLPDEDVKVFTRILHVVSNNLSGYRESDFDVPKGGAVKPVKSIGQALEEVAHPVKPARASRAVKVLA